MSCELDVLRLKFKVLRLKCYIEGFYTDFLLKQNKFTILLLFYFSNTVPSVKSKMVSFTTLVIFHFHLLIYFANTNISLQIQVYKYKL